MRGQTGLSGVLFLALSLEAAPAFAQLAPAPQRSPRTPVHREVLSGSKQAAALPTSRVLSGEATILESDRLKIDGIEIRLFGVVTPQLSASFGPQARRVMDALAAGPVTCRVRDRDREGRYLASCTNENQADFGIELLRRGLAASARGSLHATNLLEPYLAAERAAQEQRLGLWSLNMPAAASEKSIREAMVKAADAKTDPAPETKAETQAEEQAQSAGEPQAAAPLPPSVPLQVATPDSSARPPLPQVKPDGKPVALGPSADDVQALLASSTLGAPAKVAGDGPSFLEKYQLLFSTALLLGAALIVGAALVFNRWRDRRESLRALAAALRGELMSARAICLARLSKIANDPSGEKATGWPRIRTIVFQAYVSQLGRLGADLARQVASIYGQASDYASYYVGAEARPDVSSKRQSLQTLVQYIEEVVPKLSEIERSGRAPAPPENVTLSSLLGRVVRPAALGAPRPPSNGGTPAPLPPPTEAAQAPSETPPSAAESMAQATTEIVAEIKDAPRAEPSAYGSVADRMRKDIEAFNAASAPERALASSAAGTSAADAASQMRAQTKKVQRTAAAASSGRKAFSKAAPAPAAKGDHVSPLHEVLNALNKLNDLNLKEPIKRGFEDLKGFASDQWERLNPRPYDDYLPDYAHLTEEELDALAAAEEDISMGSPAGKSRHAG